MQSNRSAELILGIMVTSRAVHGVLLEVGGGATQILRRFTRQRVSRGGPGGGLMTSIPELQENNLGGGDFTIQFGEGDSSSNLFLNSEFSGMNGGDSGGGALPEGAANSSSSSFVLELGDIIQECNDAGFVDPLVAFCADSSDILHIELRRPNQPAGKDAGESDEPMFRVGKSQRSGLLKLLAGQYQGGYEADRVGFLSMSDLEVTEERYLAVFPKQQDSFSTTLQAMREQQGVQLPSVRLMDAEVSLYLGFARHAAKRVREVAGGGIPEQQQTLVVRAGIEDTMVLFIKGDKLMHYESLRSLTAFESPETICSRVLLQQDEHSISEVHHVLLLSEEREEDLIESFEMFFPDSRVESLRSHLSGFDQNGLDDSNSYAVIGALGAALRLSGISPYNGLFDEVNLMPKRLIKRRIKIPITWHVPVMALLIGLTVLFFAYKYIAVEREIAVYQERLQSYPADIMNADPRALQARIDSFNTVTEQYLNALNVLDELLVGSDKWSRTLEHIAGQTAEVRNIWIDNWQPNGEMVTIEGSATSRDRIVDLAEKIGGSIESSRFSEIREWPVFSFRMEVPLKVDLPEAAEYLRQQVDANLQQEEAATSNTTPQGQ